MNLLVNGGGPPVKIVSVGEITLDRYIDIGQTFVGGISLNFAVHAKRSGAKEVSLISRVGTEDGANVLDKLSREGIRTTFVSVLKGKTASMDVKVLSGGGRVFPEGG